MTVSVPADVISRLKAVLGEGGWSQDEDRLAPKLVEERGRWRGTTPLLVLPKYDFNWQLTYYPAKPIHLEKGTKVQVVAAFDNSADNKYNPDPAKEVHWGEQTFEEMMMGYFSVVLEPGQAPEGQVKRRQAATSGSGNE